MVVSLICFTPAPIKSLTNSIMGEWCIFEHVVLPILNGIELWKLYIHWSIRSKGIKKMGVISRDLHVYFQGQPEPLIYTTIKKKKFLLISILG